MPNVAVTYGDEVRTVSVEGGSLLGNAVIATGLPLEQPCAGRGTCLKCRVMATGDLSPLDEKEHEGLTRAEKAADYRLACRARVHGDVAVVLAPIVVYSNKMFRTCDDHNQLQGPLGLAIDLGSTTVAAFLTTLGDGQVCAGTAALNQQTIYGADVISRLAAAWKNPVDARRLSALAQSSIKQAIDALKLSRRVRDRIGKATIVGNCAMHHLLLEYPVDSLAVLPFQPHNSDSVLDAAGALEGVFPPGTRVAVPPLIGGFVGSDALACLAYFGFDRAPAPMAAVDLGTNGEVMVTDGDRIAVASTAAGPAFEGVNISCGTRAIDGAIVAARVLSDGTFELDTIGDHAPIGLTGSGLLSLVSELRRVGIISASGRMATEHELLGHRIDTNERGMRRLLLTDPAAGSGDLPEERRLYLTQGDVRELQKAKGAVRAAIDILLIELGLESTDLQRLVLTGSFGSQVNVNAVEQLGMIPPLDSSLVETEPNGAGFGAALFLDAAQFARGERIAARAEQVDLDTSPEFYERYMDALAMTGLADVQ